jgi:hypothetical protein
MGSCDTARHIGITSLSLGMTVHLSRTEMFFAVIGVLLIVAGIVSAIAFPDA